MISLRIKIDVIIVLIFSFSVGIILAQNEEDKIEQLKSNKPLYTTFNQFYTDSIRQETKDEWGGPYFKKIDQINDVHYFDYNKDGQKDALVEFSAAHSDGGTWYFLTAVLFENINGKYKYIAHIDPDHTVFEKYKNSIWKANTFPRC